jgi:parvulin-like peptidyl-prolyl isomerase
MKKILLLLSIFPFFTTSCSFFGANELYLGQIYIHCPVNNSSLAQREVAYRKINSAYQAIKVGAVNFEQSAVEVSEAPSAKKGGIMGWISTKDKTMPVLFMQAAEKLSVNEISEIVPSKYGFHIIKLYKKR